MVNLNEMDKVDSYRRQKGSNIIFLSRVNNGHYNHCVSTNIEFIRKLKDFVSV